MRISFKAPCYIKLHETVKVYLRDLLFSWAAVSVFFYVFFFEKRRGDRLGTRTLYVACSGQTSGQEIFTEPRWY